MRNAHVTGWGMAVPEQILTNHDLEKLGETTDEWIVTRTGVHERRIADEHESTASLAASAAMDAILDMVPSSL